MTARLPKSPAICPRITLAADSHCCALQVAKSLAETVLTAPGQQVKVLRVSPVSVPASAYQSAP